MNAVRQGRMRGLRRAVCVAVVGLLAPLSVSAAEKVIFLAYAQRNDPASETAAVMAAVFKGQLETATAGALRVEMFPDSQLGGNRELAKLAQQNIIQSAIVTVGGIAPFYPPIAVTEMPFAYASADTAHAVLDGPFGRKLGDDIGRRSGLTVLGFGDTGGFYVLTNSKREVRSPKDLDGITIRSIPGFEVLDAMISGLGGTPVRVSSTEEYSALEARIVDGQMNPVSVVFSRRYDGVQKYLTLTNHLFAPYVWVINTSFMDGLTAEQRRMVSEAAQAAILAGRISGRRTEESDQGLPALRRRMQVYEPTAAERAAFKAAVQPKVAETIAATLGAEGTALLQEFLAAIDQAEAAARPARP